MKKANFGKIKTKEGGFTYNIKDIEGLCQFFIEVPILQRAPHNCTVLKKETLILKDYFTGGGQKVCTSRVALKKANIGSVFFFYLL